MQKLFMAAEARHHNRQGRAPRALAVAPRHSLHGLWHAGLDELLHAVGLLDVFVIVGVLEHLEHVLAHGIGAVDAALVPLLVELDHQLLFPQVLQ